MWQPRFGLHILALLVVILTQASTPHGKVASRRAVRYYNCLKNVKAQNVSSTSITLAWDFYCENGDRYKNVRYKVTTTHLGWLACDGNQQDPNSEKHNEVDNENQITIDGLHPYSDYHFEVKAIPSKKWGGGLGGGKRPRPDEKEVTVSTAEGTPGIAPRQTRTGNPSVNSNRITFFWRKPEKKSCRFFNGEMDGFKYELKGSDSWSREDEIVGDTRPDEMRKIFDMLKPSSNYILKVYLKNRSGKINTDLPLVLKAKTLESSEVENPPGNLNAILQEESLLLSWQPPYPPTGSIEKYFIQWRIEDENKRYDKWDGKFEVVPKINSCQRLKVQTINPELMCYEVQNFTELVANKVMLENEDDSVNFGENIETKPTSQISFGNFDLTRNITFRIGAAAANQQFFEINWSKRVSLKISDRETTPKTVNETGWIAVTVIVSIVALLLFILILICARHKCNERVTRNQNQRKGAYKHVPPYESQYNGVNPPSLQTQPSVLSETTEANNSFTANLSWNKQQQPTVEFRRSLPPPQRPQRNSRNNFNAENNTLPKNGETGGSSNKSKTKDYSHILLPTSPSQPQLPPSIIGTPLPPIPTEDPIYDELQLDTMIKDSDTHLNLDSKRRSLGNPVNDPHKYSNATKSQSKKSEGFESEDDFLEPVDIAIKPTDGEDSDDNDYLAPTTHDKRPKTIDNLFRKSCSDIDNNAEDGDEYLKPTFNQFDRINSRDLSPPHERPPPIPMQSYAPLSGNERIIPIQLDK